MNISKQKRYFKPITGKLIIIVTSAILSNNLYATDLKQVYQDALKNNKTYQQAKYTYKSTYTSYPTAVAALLPTATITGNTTKTKKDHTNNNKFYTTKALDLTITQTLFNWSDFKKLPKAGADVLVAKITYQIAKQNLIKSVITSYFDVLQAIDNLDYSNANLASQNQSLNLTKEQLKVGLAAQTDVASAQAAYDQAYAQQVDANNNLANKLEAITVLTGKRYHDKDFLPLQNNFKSPSPNPKNIELWANTAKQNNLSVLAAQAKVESSQKQIDVDYGGYIPSASLTATLDHSKSQGSTTNTLTYKASANWNIGSYLALNNSAATNTYYSIKKDKLTLQANQQALQQAKRQAEMDSRTSYFNVSSDISQIKAYRQAIISGQSAVKASVAKYEAGIESIINVLQQQSALYQNQLNLSAGINTLFNHLADLKISIGALSDKTINNINSILAKKTKPNKK